MLPGQTYTPDDIARILRRRWWLVLLPLLAGTAVGVAAFLWLPERYRSETLIMVVPQQIPESYVRSTVTARMEDRLPSINDHILSRSRLERVIRDFDLYAKQRAGGALMEELVQRMRADIEVTVEAKENFRVGYVSEVPTTAQRVAERLASLYIEENLRDRAHLADSTSTFIASQLEDAKRRLLEQEHKLEEYRRRYAGQLPSQLQGNVQSIQSAQLQLQSVGESVNRARERRLLIERQLADAQTLPVPAVVADGAGSSPGQAPLTAAQQLEAARARLASAREKFGPDHPDMRALERTVRELQAAAEEEARRPADQSREETLPPAELARQKRVRELQAELEVIDRQIAVGQTEEAALKRTIADYQAKIAVVPTRESELVELTRDYSTLQETYASLLSKREESKLAANLEQRQIGEQFKVLDPASLPQKPFNQKQRLGALAGGAFGGLVLGLALVAWLEYRDMSFKREEDVLRVLSLPVLAVVPAMAEERSARVAGRLGRVRT